VLLVTGSEPIPPGRLQPKIPRDLETICLKCLEKDIPKRYSTAEALAEDLRRFLSGEPILARPIAAPARLWRWCRRNPRVAALTAAVLLLLVFVSMGSVLSNIWIRQEQAETKRQSDLAEENARLHRIAAIEARKAEKQAEENATAAMIAEKKAEENAKVANAQRTLALNTLYSLVTKVEDKLREAEGMNTLREDILTTATDGLEKVSKSVETAKVVDRSMGVAQQRMGDLYEQMGKTEQAMAVHKDSLKTFDRLAQEEPENDWLPWNQAVSYDKLGSLSHEFQGDAAAALDYYLKSLALRQRIVDQPHPVKPDFPVPRQVGMIVSCIKLSSFMRHLGEPLKAREYAGRGLEKCQALLAAAPTDFRTLYFRSGCRHLLGLAEAHLGNPNEARKLLQQTLEWRQQRSEKDKSSAIAKRELGTIYDALGDVEVEQQNYKAALVNYGKAFVLFAALHKKEPESAEDRWYLGHSYYRQGRAKELLGDHVAAQKDFTQAMKLREQLNKREFEKNLQHYSDLMLTVARLGRHREAVKMCDALCKRAPNNAYYLFTAACGYSLSAHAARAENSLQQKCARQALATLQQAIALGFKDTHSPTGNRSRFVAPASGARVLQAARRSQTMTLSPRQCGGAYDLCSRPTFEYAARWPS
jgi:serine/threonine-protein kinase